MSPNFTQVLHMPPIAELTKATPRVWAEPKPRNCGEKHVARRTHGMLRGVLTKQS